MAKQVKSKHTARKKKSRRRNALSIILIVVAIIVLVFALSRLIPILRDYWESRTAYDKLSGDIVEMDLPEEDTEGLADWAKIRIDFDALWEINPDVIGWIRFDDTNAIDVDYPILHSDDNDTYLRHDLYGTYHTAGSIFLEAANTGDFSDIYNILYGHNMRNGTMFGTLKKYRDEEGFYEANKYFTVYTPERTYRYEIFGYADIPDDDEIYQVGYSPDGYYQKLIDRMLSKSLRDTGIVPTIDDKTILLSTCTSAGERYRFVVFGICVDTYDLE